MLMINKKMMTINKKMLIINKKFTMKLRNRYNEREL